MQKRVFETYQKRSQAKFRDPAKIFRDPHFSRYQSPPLALRLGQVMYRSIPKPPILPPGQTPGHLTFLKKFGEIPRYVASLDDQMPRPLELQRGSNTPPSRHVKAIVETSSAKFSATANFLFSLLHASNKAIFHNITI